MSSPPVARYTGLVSSRCAAFDPTEAIEVISKLPPASDLGPTKTPANSVHRGTDSLAEDANASLLHDFHPDNELTNVTTYTRGPISIYIVGNNTNLVEVCLKSRAKLPIKGRVISLQSSCLVRLGTCCVGLKIVIKLVPQGPWKFGIVQGLFDMRKCGVDILRYFEWIGPVDSPGLPPMFQVLRVG